jgi:hypothetical protein
VIHAAGVSIIVAGVELLGGTGLGKQLESGWVLSAQQIEPNSSFLEPPVKPILGRKWPLIAEILDLSRQLKIGGRFFCFEAVAHLP